MISERVIEIVYNIYCELYLKPLAKKKIISASKDEKFKLKYNSEIDFIVNGRVEFVPYPCIQKGVSDIFYDRVLKLYYVYLHGKKLYYRSSGSKRQALKNINNLIIEQDQNSPHLYVEKDDPFFESNNVILIDAGSAEGNFSLEYIDKCKKVYLIEADNSWDKALNATFKPYSDKVTIINRFLSDDTDGIYSSLDDLFPDFRGEKIFIKMDIEGYGCNAIKGASRLLSNNDVFIANASYHSNDEYDIVEKYVLDNFEDYKTEASDGYVLCWFEKKLSYPFFRRGVCRIRRKEIEKIDNEF